MIYNSIIPPPFYLFISTNSFLLATPNRHPKQIHHPLLLPFPSQPSHPPDSPPSRPFFSRTMVIYFPSLLQLLPFPKRDEWQNAKARGPNLAIVGLYTGHSTVGTRIVEHTWHASITPWLVASLCVPRRIVARRTWKRDRGRRERMEESGWMKRARSIPAHANPNPRVHSTYGSRARTYSKIVTPPSLKPPQPPTAKNCPDELRGTCPRRIVVETRPSGVKLGRGGGRKGILFLGNDQPCLSVVCARILLCMIFPWIFLNDFRRYILLLLRLRSNWFILVALGWMFCFINWRLLIWILDQY